jgi:O-antigen ligase
MKKFSLPEIIVFLIAVSLPTYVLRFHIGHLPMTVLEVVVIAGIVTLVIKKLWSLRAKAKQSHESSNRDDIPFRLPRRLLHSLLAMTKNKNLLLIVGCVLIIIATVIGIIISPDKRAALGIAKAYFWEPMLFAGLIIAAKPNGKKIFSAALGGLTLAGAAVIVWGAVQYLFPSLIPTAWSAERRITSVFPFPNAVALFLAPLLPLFLSSPVGWALAIAGLGAIILAKSAGGLIAVLAAFGFLGIVNKKTRLITIFAAVSLMLVVALAPPAANLREQILLRDWSGRVHVIGWKESFAMLKDKPLFGAGLSGYQTAVAPYHTARGVEIFQYPHNLFLAIWSELGLIGLIGFGLVLIWFFKKCFTSPPPPQAIGEKTNKRRINIFLAGGMIAVIVHGLVDVPYFKNDLAVMFWILIVSMALYTYGDAE